MVPESSVKSKSLWIVEGFVIRGARQEVELSYGIIPYIQEGKEKRLNHFTGFSSINLTIWGDLTNNEKRNKKFPQDHPAMGQDPGTFPLIYPNKANLNWKQGPESGDTRSPLP